MTKSTNLTKNIPWFMIMGIISLARVQYVQAEVTPIGSVFPTPDPGSVWEQVIYGNEPGVPDPWPYDIIVGQYDVGNLNIDNPGYTWPFHVQSCTIGDNPYGIGVVVVDGITSVFQMQDKGGTSGGGGTGNGELIVGNAGQGFLNISNGALVNVVNSSVTAVTALPTIIGVQRFSQGFVNVKDNGSIWRMGELIFGNEGYGSMLVQTRGVVDSEKAIIGKESTGVGEVIVEDLASRWIISGDLFVGGEYSDPLLNGHGTLTIRNDGQVLVETIGSVESTTTISRIGLLEFGGGVLETPILNNYGVIRGDGRIEIPERVVSNHILTNYHEIRNAASTANLRERLVVTGEVHNFANATYDGRIESIGGEMEFEWYVTNDSGAQIVGRDAIYRFGTQLPQTATGLTNNGTLGFSYGESDVFGNIVNNGTIAVGHDTGVTFYDDVTNNGSLVILSGGSAMFMENLTLSGSGSVSLEFGSASADGIAQIQGAGSISLGGSLDVTLDGTFAPMAGDLFQIISGDSVAGTFSTKNLPNLPGLSWAVVYLPTSVSLNVVGPGGLAGDFDGDGVVDGSDFLIWQQGFGTTYDASDLADWQANFGTISSPMVPASTPVPEPATMILVFISAIAICFHQYLK